MPSSSIPRVKAAFVELLRAQSWPMDGPADSLPDVCYGAPRELPRECVIVGGTAGSDQSWVVLSGLFRDEDYELDCVVWVARPGDDQQEATERAFALLAVAEEALRSTSELTGDVLWSEISSPDLSEGATPEGRFAELRFSVRVKGRI